MDIKLNSPASPVLVTGGASGIGEATAEALAAVKRPVALWDLQADKASYIHAAEIVVDGGNISSQR